MELRLPLGELFMMPELRPPLLRAERARRLGVRFGGLGPPWAIGLLPLPPLLLLLPPTVLFVALRWRKDVWRRLWALLSGLPLLVETELVTGPCGGLSER